MSLDRNPFDALRAAVHEARDLNRAVDLQSNALADLLQGRLQVHAVTLAKRGGRRG